MVTHEPTTLSSKPPQLVVVIPCHDEPDLLTTLASLWCCQPPPCCVEVIVVINGCQDDSNTIQKQNHLTHRLAQQWYSERCSELKNRVTPYRLLILFEPTLPARQAGVGSARKMGMDWAVNRLSGRHSESGIIVCLDADCSVEENYLQALFEHFQNHPKTPGCAIHFEHPLTNLPVHQRQGIIYYELYMRYYLHALRWCGFPHAYHTVGSSMAVRPAVYQRQGGMNRRKAGEDFYFLQKIIPLGNFSELRHTTVFPAARPSHRVPFGTGRSIAAWLAGDNNPSLTYDPQAFQALAVLFRRVTSLYDSDPETVLQELPQPLQQFLHQREFRDRLLEVRRHTGSLPAFQKRFFHLFNAFQILKYVHFVTEHAWPKIPVCQAATTLLQSMGELSLHDPDTNHETLLEQYRRLDREGFWMRGW